MNEDPQEDVFSGKLDWNMWKRVFRHALPHRRLLRPLAFSAILLAVCDASFALVIRWAVDSAVMALEKGETGVPWAPLIVYSLLALALALGVWLFINAAGALTNHMSHDIRRDCFQKLQELEFAWFDHRPTGWLISRLTSDCDKLARIIGWGTLDLVWAFCLVTIIAVILLALHFTLGLLVLSLTVPLFWISAIFQKKLLLSSRETRRCNSLITAAFSEALQGLRTSRVLGREAENLRDFQRLSNRMYAVSLQNARQSAVYLPLVLTLGSVAAGLALWQGGGHVIRDSMSLGTLVAFLFYTGQFFQPLNQAALLLVQMQGAQAAGERVLSLLATAPAIVDSPEVQHRVARWDKPDRPAGVAPDGHPDIVSKVVFEEVGFSYQTGEPVLQNFNLEVGAGQTIALVGASGGGKSTIVNLAARFYEPTTGRILVNDQDLRARSLAWYQSKLGIVLQTPHLFAGTIRSNIRYGRLEATDAEVEEAARQVNADGFIRQLGQGYETDVGEGGSRLSTGQKQLISFARALLSNPAIFIMDEATSSIDTETEQWIQQGLKSMFAGRISFVIAHRLSTIRNADRILVIREGKIVESGTHEELMSRRGAYHELYTRQFATTRTAALTGGIIADASSQRSQEYS